MIFIWSAPHRYAIRNSIAEIAPFCGLLLQHFSLPQPAVEQIPLLSWPPSIYPVGIAAFMGCCCTSRRFAVFTPMHPHLLRHACATHLLNNGCSLDVIADLLGHVNLDITAQYAQAQRGWWWTHIAPLVKSRFRKRACRSAHRCTPFPGFLLSAPLGRFKRGRQLTKLSVPRMSCHR